MAKRLIALAALAAMCGTATALPALASAQAPATAGTPPPLSVYGALPQIEDAALSPDGDRIAILTTADDGSRTVMLMSAAREVSRVFKIGDSKIRSIAWGGGDHLIVQATSTERLYGFTVDKMEFTSTFIIPASPQDKVAAVFDNRRNLVSATFGNHGTRRVNGRWYAYYGAIELMPSQSGYVFDHGRPSLYRVEIATNKPELVAKAGGENVWRDWLIGADGSVAAVLDVNRSDGGWTIRAGRRTIAEGRSATGDASLIAIGKAGDSIVYGTRDEAGDTQWYEVPLSGGTPIAFHPENRIERLYIDRTSGNALGILTGGDDGGPKLYDQGHQAAMTKIRNAFANYDLGIVDFTPDLKRAIVRTSGNGDSGSWFIVDVANLKAQAIGYERVAIRPDHVGPISTIEYTAGDGLKLSGILTLPPDREAKALPVVILPHGGPASHDRAQFDWWAQAFASRGYAVFQPNFRGSTNGDESLRRAGHGEWGGKMQTDLSDGLAALGKRGIVDPARACIVGASYGGYAALAGVTLQSDLYRCAVSVNGVSDIADMYAEDFRGSGEARVSKAALLEQLGARDRWPARSPRRHAAKADAPVLLIHGKDDTVVPYSHSTRMADALKDARKPVELVTLAGEDHWLSRAATRQEMLQTAVSFVEKHNPAHP